jgi:hypothetical protein
MSPGKHRADVEEESIIDEPDDLDRLLAACWFAKDKGEFLVVRSAIRTYIGVYFGKETHDGGKS